MNNSVPETHPACAVCQENYFPSLAAEAATAAVAPELCVISLLFHYSSPLNVRRYSSRARACSLARAWIETNSASNLSKHASYYQIFAQCSHSGSTCKLIKVTPPRWEFHARLHAELTLRRAHWIVFANWSNQPARGTAAAAPGCSDFLKWLQPPVYATAFPDELPPTSQAWEMNAKVFEEKMDSVCSLERWLRFLCRLKLKVRCKTVFSLALLKC